jgi:hypothetical protein
MPQNTSFSGPIFPNPDNLRPHLDTDPVEPRDKIQGATMHMDTPLAADINPHPMEEAFKKPESVRHPVGRGVPRSHPALKVSEN